MRLERCVSISSVVMLLTCNQVIPVQATTINYNLSGEVTGVSQLMVGTDYFNVTFSVGGLSYDTAYGNVAVTYSNSLAVTDALVAALNGLYPNIPFIAGTGPTTSGFIVPLSLTGSGDVDISYYASKGTLPTGLYHTRTTLAAIPHDEPRQDALAWAYVNPVPVPNVGAGLPGLLAAGALFAWWRRKRKGAA